MARDLLLVGLPKVVAKRAGAPAGSAVVLDVHGTLEFMRTVRIDAAGQGTMDSAPSLGPAVTLAMDWETYVRLAAGRGRWRTLADLVKVEGDPDLAEAILSQFAVTP